MKTRKIISLILALAMVLTMASSLTFANTDWTTTGDITVRNAQPGKEYQAFKVFDMTYNAAKDAYSYTIAASNQWFEVLSEGAIEAYGLELEETQSTTSEGDAIYNVKVVDYDSDSTDAAEFAKFLRDKAGSMKPDYTKECESDATTVKFEDVPTGYWFVNTNGGSICSLDSNSPNASMVEKNQPIQINKTVKNLTAEANEDGFDYNEGTTGFAKSTTADMGDKVEFKIDSTVPYTSKDLETYNYVIEDTYENTQFSTTSAVYMYVTQGGVSTKVSPAAYTVNDWTDHSFKITFDMAVDFWEKYEGGTLTISYTAITLTSSAIAATSGAGVVEGKKQANVNNVALTYDTWFADSLDENDVNSDFGDKAQRTVTSAAMVYTSDIDINKVAENAETGGVLSGAAFVLYRTSNGAVEYYKFDKEQGDVVWTKLDGKFTSEFIEKSCTVITSGGVDLNGKEVTSEGYCRFTGLNSKGTYYIQEIGAPAGYQLLVDDIEVDLDKLKEAEEFTESYYTGYTDSGTQYNPNVWFSNSDSFKVVNVKGNIDLPSTGGMGTVIFYVLGAILMLGAGVLLITRKRMSSNR